MGIGSRSIVLQRRLEIADRIRRHGSMRVETLSAELGVSAVTIRGDLSYLEEQGLILRTNGRARPAAPDRPAPERPRASAATLRPLLLDAAALAAEARSLLVGPGPVPAQLLPFLPPDPHRSVILCSLEALPVATTCLDGPLHLLGGRVLGDGVGLDGPEAVQALSFYRPDLFVLFGTGVAGQRLLIPHEPPGTLHLAALRQAARTMALLLPQGRSRPDRSAGLDLDALDHLLLPADMPPASLRELARQLEPLGFGRDQAAYGSIHFRKLDEAPLPGSGRPQGEARNPSP
jgi:DeoR/GlpR family transcriptional regulator of sugar metabolism